MRMMKRGWMYAWRVVLFAVLPGRAWADVGTPLMWAELGHLVLGNLLIGIGEGILLARLFRVAKGKAIGLMIAANYFSAWVGLVFVRGAIVRAVPMDLNNAWSWFWIMVGVAYLMTIVLEWPFVAGMMKGRARWARDAWKASLVVQTASYAVLLAGYLCVSRVTLFTNADVVAPQELALPSEVQVYYIGEDDGAVYQRGLIERAGQKVFELKSVDSNDRVVARQEGNGRWDILAWVWAKETHEGKLVPILTSQTLTAVAVWKPISRDDTGYIGSYLNAGPAAVLGDNANAPWTYAAGFYFAAWLEAARKTTGERVLLEWETPFAFWAVRNVVRLPNGMALFQLGWDQICVFDAATRRVALLWHGRGLLPVIAGEKGAAKK
jgi:hypothetical protein